MHSFEKDTKLTNTSVDCCVALTHTSSSFLGARAEAGASRDDDHVPSAAREGCFCKKNLDADGSKGPLYVPLVKDARRKWALLIQAGTMY